MALTAVVRAVHTSRPDLSLRSEAVVGAVLLSGGSIGTAGEVAPYLGLHDRFELARLLKRERLPALHHLAGWASVLTWLEGTESTECSLCQLAFRARKDPAACYRIVKRITGLAWLEVRRRGSAWAIRRFMAQCGGGQSSPRQSGTWSTRRGGIPQQTLAGPDGLLRRDPSYRGKRGRE